MDSVMQSKIPLYEFHYIFSQWLQVPTKMSYILLQNISDIFYDNLSCIPELYPVKSYGAMYMLVRNSWNCNEFIHVPLFSLLYSRC
jgi:hypothetical protein